MVNGKVKWFDVRKGFGFILNPNGGEDIFVHFSNIVSEEKFRFLNQDADVDFALEARGNRLQALNVREKQGYSYQFQGFGALEGRWGELLYQEKCSRYVSAMYKTVFRLILMMTNWTLSLIAHDAKQDGPIRSFLPCLI